MRGSYLGVIAVLLGVAQAATASEASPQIVVVVAPLTPYVNAITQNIAHAQSLLQPGQDPHHFALAPSQQRMLEMADILVIPDLSMSPAISDIRTKQPHLKVIELSKLPGAHPLPYEDDNPWLAAVKKKGGDEDDDKPAPVVHEDGYKRLPDFNARTDTAKTASPTVDPHFWLDPERMAAIALPLADTIGEFTPANRSTLEVNAKTLASHLRQQVLPEMQTLLTPKDHAAVTNKAQIPFITYHAAYQYFLGRFSLSHEGEITTRPEDYMGAKTLDKLLATAKTVKVRCIIGEANGSLVTRIAALSGAKVVILSPEQNISENEVPPLPWITSGYDRLLYKTAKSFGECL